MRGHCTFLLSVLLYPLLLAQELHFSFTHLSAEQGLAANQVNAIAQDSRGYIWLGASHGLQRYDGRRFWSFKHDPDDARTIPSNVVKHLRFDRHDRLWLMSGEGKVGIFDPLKGVFQKVDVFDGPKKMSRLPEAIFLDDAWGNIFILGKKGGLFIWNENKGAFHSRAFPPPAAQDWQVAGLAPRPGTSDYILSFGSNGLFLFHTEQGNWNDAGATLTPLHLPDYPKEAVAYNVFVDRADRLWFQCWPSHTPKVYAYDLERRKPLIQDYEPTALVGAYIETEPFFQSQDGAVWIYGGDIFARHDEASNAFQLVYNGYLNQRSIQYRTINTLFEDRENTLWVGTSDNGIFFFNPGKTYFRNVDHYNRRLNRRGNGSPTDFMELGDGTVLVSVWGDGMYRYDREWKELPFECRGDTTFLQYSIWSMYRSRRPGVIWLSSQPGRIIRYDESTKKAEMYHSALLEGRTIRQVVEDRRGDLWLGMHTKGVYRWTCDASGRPMEGGVTKFDEIPDCRVSKLMIDSKGLLWVGAEVHGLYLIDPESGKVHLHLSDTHADANFRLIDPSISSVLEYHDSIILISGFSSLQAFHRERQTLTRLKYEPFLAGYIADLVLDRSGHVWVSTTSGLYRVSLQNSTVLKFGRRDGIDDEQFTVSASCVLSDGRLLFGASETFVVFDPAVFQQIESVKPEATITALRINNRLAPLDSLENAGALRLRYRESALSIEFSTLQYYRGHSIRYKMEGLDQDWQLNEHNLAIYSFLPSGAYRFLLQPIYADGTLGIVASLRITRDPPFWQAWWFYSLLFLSGGGIIYLFDRESMRRKKSVRQMRAKIADQLYADIRLALNSIHILSEIAVIKARKTPASALAYLGQIKSKSLRMLQDMDDILWAVAPENDRMSKIVARIEAYARKLHGEGQAAVEMRVDPKIGNLALDTRQRQLLLRLAKSSINGLLRAGARELQLSLERERAQLHYVILFEQAEVDMTLLNNFLQAQDMSVLMANLGAARQVELPQSNGRISFHIPI
jgi:ligand-binding sensor domain-containing protein